MSEVPETAGSTPAPNTAMAPTPTDANPAAPSTPPGNTVDETASTTPTHTSKVPRSEGNENVEVPPVSNAPAPASAVPSPGTAPANEAASPSAAPRRRDSLARQFGFLGAGIVCLALIVAGMFLPYFRSETYEGAHLASVSIVNGSSGEDSLLFVSTTIITAIALLIQAAGTRVARALRYAASALPLLSAGVLLGFLGFNLEPSSNIMAALADDGASWYRGAGFWLIALGAVCLIVLSIAFVVATMRSSRDNDVPDFAYSYGQPGGAPAFGPRPVMGEPFGQQAYPHMPPAPQRGMHAYGPAREPYRQPGFPQQQPQAFQPPRFGQAGHPGRPQPFQRPVLPPQSMPPQQSAAYQGLVPPMPYPAQPQRYAQPVQPPMQPMQPPVPQVQQPRPYNPQPQAPAYGQHPAPQQEPTNPNVARGQDEPQQ
ncbi:hypothetical protein I6E29_05670 [Arcanobacterium haemolyticum]|nr:hypothetical protein [Arcanobacterium haemolyticum]